VLLFCPFSCSEWTHTLNEHNSHRSCLFYIFASPFCSFFFFFSVVPQDCVLFNDSVLNNIRYGNLNATDEEVYEAAKKCRLHDSVSNWPEGYHTVVGERGLKLSGGEKQRVALARALLKDSPILVCDEATSALDGVTESDIIETMKAASVDRTTIIIAHRLSTIMHADNIAVIRDGKISEFGNHNTLIGNPNSYYGELWKNQMEESPIGVGKRVDSN